MVSPRSMLGAVMERHRPARVVSLRAPDAAPLDFPRLGTAQVLHLAFNDVSEDRPGLVSPSPDHVSALLAFADAWSEGAMLVHCYAGISRSTAAALAVAAALAPAREATELAQTLRRLAPEATPNPYLVRLADGMLGRGGTLVRAVAAIGRGAEAFEGKPFVLPIEVEHKG